MSPGSVPRQLIVRLLGLRLLGSEGSKVTNPRWESYKTSTGIVREPKERQH